MSSATSMHHGNVSRGIGQCLVRYSLDNVSLALATSSSPVDWLPAITTFNWTVFCFFCLLMIQLCT